jgi:hypothetical protein
MRVSIFLSYLPQLNAIGFSSLNLSPITVSELHGSGAMVPWRWVLLLTVVRYSIDLKRGIYLFLSLVLAICVVQRQTGNLLLLLKGRARGLNLSSCGLQKHRNWAGVWGRGLAYLR